MKRILLCASIFILTTACSPGTKENNAEQEVIKAEPTVDERDAYLSLNEFISEFEHTSSEGFNYLTIKMNEEFAQMKVSEQYLYLVRFYEAYNVDYSALLPGNTSFLNRLNVYFNDTEFPTYGVALKAFSFYGVNLDLDREVGQIPNDNILLLVDSLDKVQVMSGTRSGLTLAEVEEKLEPPIKNTIITSAGEVKGALQASAGVINNKGSSSTSNNNMDSETYIDGMTGDRWSTLTDNQKFHAVSNALYSLDQNGYIIEESESFYIDSLNAFYTDPSTMNTPVSEALGAIGAMSNTIKK